MDKFTPEEVDQRKRAIFERMSARRREAILKRGYEKWDPFQEPKDPIDIRRDKSRRTTQQLVREFLQTHAPVNYSNLYGQAVLEMSLGIVNGDERYQAMYDFACWYRDLLRREGLT
jgi:hypothetical protein